MASIDPLVVLFHDGFGRVSNVEYTESDFSNFDAHVTNISQNGRAVSWEDVATNIRRHFTHHEELAYRLGKDLDPVSHVLNQMKAILVDIINSFREASFGVGSPLSDNGFNILALDFYIDNDLDVFLIEPQSQPKLDYADEARQAAARTVARKFQSDFLDVAWRSLKNNKFLDIVSFHFRTWVTLRLFMTRNHNPISIFPTSIRDRTERRVAKYDGRDRYLKACFLHSFDLFVRSGGSPGPPGPARGIPLLVF